jgi:uncharacterized protein with HEPN domain
MDTFEGLRDKILHKLDVIELVEMFDITTEDILDRFEDRLELFEVVLQEYLRDE